MTQKHKLDAHCQHAHAAHAVCSNSVMAELLKHSKLLAASRGAGSTSDLRARGDASGGGGGQGDSSAEDGEVLPSPRDAALDADGGGGGNGGAAGGKRQRHAPIVWDPPSKKQAVSSGGGGGVVAAAAGAGGLGAEPAGLLERAQHEARMLRQMMLEEEGGIDPDAPAAMKASPSGSSGGWCALESGREGARGREGGRVVCARAGFAVPLVGVACAAPGAACVVGRGWQGSRTAALGACCCRARQRRLGRRAGRAGGAAGRGAGGQRRGGGGGGGGQRRRLGRVAAER